METKSDKPKKAAVAQLPATKQKLTLKVLRCAHCQKQVAYHLKDCPWCGSSLAFGWLEEK